MNLDARRISLIGKGDKPLSHNLDSGWRLPLQIQDVGAQGDTVVVPPRIGPGSVRSPSRCTPGRNVPRMYPRRTGRRTRCGCSPTATSGPVQDGQHPSSGLLAPPTPAADRATSSPRRDPIIASGVGPRHGARRSRGWRRGRPLPHRRWREEPGQGSQLMEQDHPPDHDANGEHPAENTPERSRRPRRFRVPTHRLLRTSRDRSTTRSVAEVTGR